MRPKRFGLEKVRKGGTFVRQTNDWEVSKIKVCCCIPKLYLSNTESIKTGEAWLRKQHTSNKKSSWQFSTFPKLGPLGFAKQIASVKRKYCSENSCSRSSFHKVVPFFHLLNFSFGKIDPKWFCILKFSAQMHTQNDLFLEETTKVVHAVGEKVSEKGFVFAAFFWRKLISG